jgi:hypothetical protein
MLPGALQYMQRAHLSFSHSTVTTAGSGSCVVMAAQLTAFRLLRTKTLCSVVYSSKVTLLPLCS